MTCFTESGFNNKQIMKEYFRAKKKIEERNQKSYSTPRLRQMP